MAASEREDLKELLRVQFHAIDTKLDRVMEKQDVHNGRLGQAEVEIARLQERVHPLTAGGISGGLTLIGGVIYELFSKKP
jgi:hypothetical protein